MASVANLMIEDERRPSKRPHNSTPDTSPEYLLERIRQLELGYMESKAEIVAEKEKVKAEQENVKAAKERAEVAEAHASPQIAWDGLEKGLAQVEAAFRDGSAVLESEPTMETTQGKRRLPRMPLVCTTIALIMAFFCAAAANLNTGVCAPNPAFVASFYTLLVTIASEQHPSGATAWVDPNPLYALLFYTSPIVFMTDWRPFSDGMTSKASEIGTACGFTGQMRLPCLSSYMKPTRISFTGAVIGACILTIASAVPVTTPDSEPPNALCFDLLCAYLIAAGDQSRGYHENEPDRAFNASISERLCSKLLPLIFYDPQRLFICVDSDMNKVALFKWFADEAREGRCFTALVLSEKLISYIAGYSSALFAHTTTTAVWLVLVPGHPAGDRPHIKIVVFGYSQCYGNWGPDKWGVTMKHFMCNFIRGLGLLNALPFDTLSHLYACVDASRSAWLSNKLCVLYRTPAQAGGDWSPYKHAASIGYSAAALDAIVDKIKKLVPKGATVAACRELIEDNCPGVLFSCVASLIGSAIGGKWSPYMHAELLGYSAAALDAIVDKIKKLVPKGATVAARRELIEDNCPGVLFSCVASLIGNAWSPYMHAELLGYSAAALDAIVDKIKKLVPKGATVAACRELIEDNCPGVLFSCVATLIGNAIGGKWSPYMHAELLGYSAAALSAIVDKIKKLMPKGATVAACRELIEDNCPGVLFSCVASLIGSAIGGGSDIRRKKSCKSTHSLAASDAVDTQAQQADTKAMLAAMNATVPLALR